MQLTLMIFIGNRPIEPQGIDIGVSLFKYSNPTVDDRMQSISHWGSFRVIGI